MKSHIEEMKISIEMAKENNPMISIQITNPNDPLILYILDLSEIEYQNIMKEQKILVNFEDFPNFLKNLVELCSDCMNRNYSAKLEINNSPEVVFCIEEKIKFKITEHIRLKLKKANDEELKKYLSTIYLNLKRKYNDMNIILNDSIKKNDILVKENENLKNILQEKEFEYKNNLENLKAEKNTNINILKEEYNNKFQQQFNLFEKEKNVMQKNYDNKIYDLESKINDLNSKNKILEEKIIKNNLNEKNISEKCNKSNTELAEKVLENQKISSENKNINEKNLILEKNLSEIKFQYDTLEKELEESKKNNFDLNIIINSLQKELQAKEDSKKSIYEYNMDLKAKLDRGIEEIKKGNNIIDKMTNDIKNKKDQIKSLKQTVETQEQLINQKENIIVKQNKDLSELKTKNEKNALEIDELKNKVSDYTMKFIDYERLLEENKKMILYLNKNLNDIVNAPFKQRFNKNIQSNNAFNNNDENYLEERKESNKDNIGIIKDSSLYNGDYILDNINLDLNSNVLDDEGGDGMAILPDTNICNYKVSGKLGFLENKYRNERRYFDNDNSLLEYKYGNDSNNNIGNVRSTYNIEEEFPTIKTNNINIKDKNE